MQNKAFRFCAYAIATLSVSGSALAFTYAAVSDVTGLPARWTTSAYPMRIYLGTSPTLQDGSNYSTSVQTAMLAWNAVLGSTQFQATITTGTPAQRNNINELAFASTVYGTEFDANTLAITTSFSNPSSNALTQADIIFNSARTWNSYRGATQSGVVDIQRVALHELGHALGLDHPNEAVPPQTVTAIMNSRVSNLDALATDDISGAQNLYGPPGAPVNNNFANAITITGDNATVTGYNTNSTKEAGEPNHAGNAGGRSVWWKWTASAPGSVNINTRNSYYDTTLGIYTGTAVNALTTIASNDDISNGVVQASSVTFTATAGTTYYIAVDGFDADTAGITLNVALTATGPAIPTITTQPVSQTASVGASISFTVAATAGTATPTYQWQFNGAAIAGATGPTHTISSVAATNGGSYNVVVSSSAGSVTSNTATLTVNTPVVVTPPSTGGGGGGGGGAPSLWFVAALSLLGLSRKYLRSRRS